MPDIRPKHSLKEILPAGRKRPSASAPQDLDYQLHIKNDPYSARATTPAGGRFWMAMIVIGLLAAIGYYISLSFAIATVNITPKKTSFDVTGEFDASKTPADGELEFGTVSKITASASRELSATGSEKVQTKAQGKVTIYNNFNTSAQKLVAGTRLTTKDGKIYRLTQAVTIPGQQKKGADLVPGSTEANVAADAYGQEYNQDKADFNFVGFKGSPKYDKIYATSKGAIAGGMIGTVKKVDDNARAKARTEMQSELTSKILTVAKTQVSKDFVLYDDAAFITFNEQIATSSDPNKVSVAMTANLSAAIFNRQVLSKYLAQKSVSNLDEGNVTIKNLDSFRFKMADKDKMDVGTIDKITFGLEGKADMVWDTNVDSLKAKLKGLSRNNKDIFINYPSIERAETTITPPWIFSFPSDVNKIKVVVN